MTDGHPHDLRADDPRTAELLDALDREREEQLAEDLRREKAPQREESQWQTK